jgi:hypothetical protein
MAEILASLDDINANLPSEENVVIEATTGNSDLIQVSVARVVRGYLSSTLTPEILMSWASPETTPQIIREVAAKLIAAQLFFNETAKSSLDIDPNSFAQKLYNEAIALLTGMTSGVIQIDDPTGGLIPMPELGLSELDFFPVDATDQAFSKEQIFYGLPNH